MSETGIAGLCIALAVVIVLSGPARMLRLGKLFLGMLRGLRRGGRKAAAGE